MTSGCAGRLDDKWASLTNRSNPLLCHGASALSRLRRSGQDGSLLSTDAGTAMGGRMCVGRSVFAVRLRTPSPTLLRTSCRWRSGATPVTTVPPSLANRMLSLPLSFVGSMEGPILLPRKLFQNSTDQRPEDGIAGVYLAIAGYDAVIVFVAPCDVSCS